MWTQGLSLRHNFHPCSLGIKQRKNPIAGLWLSGWAQQQQDSVTLHSKYYHMGWITQLFPWFSQAWKSQELWLWSDTRRKQIWVNPGATDSHCTTSLWQRHNISQKEISWMPKIQPKSASSRLSDKLAKIKHTNTSYSLRSWMKHGAHLNK